MVGAWSGSRGSRGFDVVAHSLALGGVCGQEGRHSEGKVWWRELFTLALGICMSD